MVTQDLSGREKTELVGVWRVGLIKVSALPMELPLENARFKQTVVQTGGMFLKLPSSDGWKLKPLFSR